MSERTDWIHKVSGGQASIIFFFKNFAQTCTDFMSMADRQWVDFILDEMSGV